MAPRSTQFLQTVIFLLLSNLLIGNNPGKDFLITLNGAKLTGNVKDLSLSNNKSHLSFENDFGDVYTIHPATINGFTFDENGETSLYESKFVGGTWQFLKVEKKGQALTLYKSSERQLKFINSNEAPIVEKEKAIQIWLQFAKEQPFKIHRLTFKSTLKKKMAAFPEIVDRLGKRGFKYNNLPSIVELYNRLHATTKL